MATFIKGEDLILYIYDSSAYEPIACLTSNSLQQSVGVIETQTKCDPGVTVRRAGTMSYELSCEGMYIDTTSVGSETTKQSHDSLKALLEAGTAVTWKLDTGLTDTTAYYGSAIITELSMDAPSGDEFATFSCTLSGSGSIATTDPMAT